MPHFTLKFSQDGRPLIRVAVGVSSQRARAMEQMGIPVPDFVEVMALVDTGASSTAVDEDVLAALHLRPSAVVPIFTPSSGPSAVPMLGYDVAIGIPARTGDRPLLIGQLPVTGNHLKNQGFDVLIGRDVLSHCILVYDGAASTLTLGF